MVFRESWAAKKSRIRGASPYGHLANWDVSLRYMPALLRADDVPVRFSHREDWWRFATRTTGSPTYPVIREDLASRERLMLGSIVGRWFHGL